MDMREVRMLELNQKRVITIISCHVDFRFLRSVEIIYNQYFLNTNDKR